MKKILLILLLTILSFILFSWLIVNYIGDIRPVLLPGVKSKPSSVVKPRLGYPLDFEIKLVPELQIGYYAKDLGNVRDLTFSPGGVLIASIPNQGKVIMLPDRNNDGIADEVDTIVSGLNNPHGIAFYNNFLYVAEETKVGRYLWTDQTLIGGVARLEKKLFDLPKGGRHNTRSITFDNNGLMYVSIGSSCDMCIEKDQFLGSVITSDWQGKKPVLYAKGLRNSPFIIINPHTQELWGTEMGRDFLGDSLPPDEINIIRNKSTSEVADYGWPLCYGDKKHDSKFDKNIYTENPCINTTAPVFQIPAHSAPLGLQFIKTGQLPEGWQNDLLVSYHGSWNSTKPVGYKIVRLTTASNSKIIELDFLSGLLQNGTAVARPVDMEFDNKGNLYISDDKGGNIFIISKK